METKENKCKNCKFFIRYYINSDGNFYPIHLGHCICESQRKYYLKNVSFSDACEYFLAEGKNNLKQLLKNH